MGQRQVSIKARVCQFHKEFRDTEEFAKIVVPEGTLKISNCLSNKFSLHYYILEIKRHEFLLYSTAEKSTEI